MTLKGWYSDIVLTSIGNKFINSNIPYLFPVANVPLVTACLWPPATSLSWLMAC